MNGNEFAPDDNSAGKMDESKVVDGFFLKTNQELTKAIEKRVCDFNNPTAGFEVRITFQFLLFLTPRPNVGRIATLLYLCVTACITSVQAQILRGVFHLALDAVLQDDPKSLLAV